MRLLIIGGTVFLGRHLAEAARERGHAVTLFNRGQSNPDAVAPEIEQIRGDREHRLGALQDRDWDAVIDTCGYLPRVVRLSAERLAARSGHYTFVSSISVYGTFERAEIDEDQPPATLADPASEDVGAHYGELKALCEDEVRAAFGDRALIVRPGLIVGPHDPSERFTYWVRRMAEGGDVLVPDAPSQAVQLIDVRDLARWMMAMSERATAGTFNATGPAERLTLAEMLNEVRAVTAAGTRLAPRAEEDLAGAGVEPWSELPLWLDVDRNPAFTGFMAADIRRALAAGLALRPLRETIADTLAWVRERDDVPGGQFGVPLQPAGLGAERERELLTTLRPAQ